MSGVMSDVINVLSAILHGKRSFWRFWAPLGGLWATYDDQLRLTGKRVADFLLVLI